VAVLACPDYLIKVSENQDQPVDQPFDFGILKSRQQKKTPRLLVTDLGRHNPAVRQTEP
jgi:hypothetical protein